MEQRRSLRRQRRRTSSQAAKNSAVPAMQSGRMLWKSVVCFIFVCNVVLFVLFLAVLLTNKDNKKSICPLLAVCLSFERNIRGSFSSGGIAVFGLLIDSGRRVESAVRRSSSDRQPAE